MEDTGSSQTDMIERLGFFIGDWRLDYKVPKSRFSEAATGTGTGTFSRALNGIYVYFDYSCSLTTSLTTGQAQAHGISAWDQKAYRYWWFEDSGSFSEATGDFVDEGTLLLKWYDTGLIQTFKRVDADKIILEMADEATSGKHELVLEVVLTREKK